MSEEWVDITALPLIADTSALNDLDEYRLRRNGNETEETGWTPRDLSSLDDKPPIEPTLGGLGFIYPGKRHLFSGPQESAKTLAAYIVGLAVVRSGSRILVIDFEMGPYDARNRFRELGATVEELAMISYVDPDVPASQESMEALVALNPSLVIVDAAAGAFDAQGLDDNKRGDVERFASLYLNPFRRAGIATLVLDHVVKSVEGRANYAIGSERKVGVVETHIGFTVIEPIKRGEKGRYKLMTHKDRGGFLKRGRLAELELDSDATTHAITWRFVAPQEVDETHPFRPTVLMERVSKWLEMQLAPVTQNMIESNVTGKSKPLREAIERLVIEGYIDRSEGPNKSSLMESIEPYREVSDPRLASASPVRPECVPESSKAGASLRPSPYGGDAGDARVPGDVPEVGRTHDDIPF